MAQLLIRNLDQACVDRLKRVAAQNGRSLQAEAKLILEQAAQLDPLAARKMADEIRAKLKGSSTTDSTELLREMRGG